MSFVTESRVGAVRKRHVCDGCNKHIEVGSPAVRWAGLTEGDFGTAIYHPECRSAEVDMNNDVLGWQYGDDWIPLYDIEREDWPWLVEKYPAIAQRMGIATPPPESSAADNCAGEASQSAGQLRDDPLPTPEQTGKEG